MKRNSSMILALTLGVVLFVAGSLIAGSGCPSQAAAKACDTKTATAQKITAKEGEEIVVLNVSKVTCGGCVKHVTQTLTAIDGVSDVLVSLEDGTATIAYAKAKVKPEMLTAAVIKAGYPTTVAGADNEKAQSCDPKACKAKGCDPTACGLKTKSGDSGK